jgi:hypothetical protein
VGKEASNKDVIYCRTEYALVKEWVCTLEDGSIKWEPGVHMLDLGSEIFPTEEVAEFLQQHHRLNEERKLEPEELVRRIEALNPRLRGTGACWGQVRFKGGLAPYAPDEGHYYRKGS